jgi:hypothetical protein
MNLLLDRGPSFGIIRAVSASGDVFERRVWVSGYRRLIDLALRTLENDPYLREVGAIVPKHPRRLVAVFERPAIRRKM